MKKKLSLNELKVKSFVTSVKEKDKVKSGLDTIFQVCALSGELCNETDNPIECPPTMEPPKESRSCVTQTFLLNIDCGPKLASKDGGLCT